MYNWFISGVNLITDDYSVFDFSKHINSYNLVNYTDVEIAFNAVVSERHKQHILKALTDHMKAKFQNVMHNVAGDMHSLKNFYVHLNNNKCYTIWAIWQKQLLNFYIIDLVKEKKQFVAPIFKRAFIKQSSY